MPRKKSNLEVETKVQEPIRAEEAAIEEAVQEENSDRAEESASGKAERKDDGYVEYCLPFLPGVKPGDYQTVTINGKNYQVKYGENIRMPKGVADILKEMVKSYITTEEKAARLQKETCITVLE